MAESNKQRLASHNERLQNISDGLDDLPEYEDVNPEVTEQEDIIAEILATLPYKGQPIVEYEVGTTDIGEGAELAANTLYLMTSS